MRGQLPKKLAAEIAGTFCLVFAGTGAIVMSGDGAVSQVVVALTFGLVVFAMIAVFRDVSGAHFNPAVTVGLYLARRFSGREVVPYILSQCLAAVLASLCVWLMFPADGNLGATLPTGPLYQSWVLEVLLATLLMSVILGVSMGASEKGIAAAMAIGATVALCALFAGPVSGASMNPARSLGPAVMSWQLEALWLYITAPFIGAALAVVACRCVRHDCCCRPVALGDAE